MKRLVVALVLLSRSSAFEGREALFARSSGALVEEFPKLRSDAWAQNIRTLPKSKMLRRVGSHLTFTGAWTALVIAGNDAMPGMLPSVDPQPVTIVSTCLTILLGFRTSQSYDRFWDGRNSWSEVWASCRALTRVGGAYYDDLTEAEEEPGSSSSSSFNAALALVATYPYALLYHLRNQTAENAATLHDLYLEFADDVGGVPDAPANALHLKELATRGEHVPIALLDALSLEFRDLRPPDAPEYPVSNLEAHLDRLGRALCSAERIVMTPVPPSYTRHTSRVTTLWSLALPFCFDQVERPAIVLASVLLVSWALYTLEEIGKVIEEPFGSDAEDLALDLPLDKYALSIATDVLRSRRRRLV